MTGQLISVTIVLAALIALDRPSMASNFIYGVTTGLIMRRSSAYH